MPRWDNANAVGRKARPTSDQASALLGGSGFTPDNSPQEGLA